MEINNPIIYDKDLKVLHSKTIKKANKFTVGMAARWDPVKNHQLAFEAFAGFQLIEPNSEFVLCGSGINWENKSLVNMLNKFQIVDKVKLLDILTEMDTFYNAVDILLITSYSEALPNIVVEALLYETPIVSVPAGDIPKILDDLGMLVSYEPHSITKKMAQVCYNYKASIKKIQSFKLEGHLDRYTAESVHSKYCEVFDEL